MPKRPAPVDELGDGNDVEVPNGRAFREVQVPAVSRAIAILRLLSSTTIPLGVNQIAREVNIIPSTCLHILRTLASEGLLSFDQETKQYRLGLQLLTLAKAVLKESIADRAQPFLDDIVRKNGVTALAVSASGSDHVIVTALANALQPIRLHVDLGSRFPALISATGRCVAAYSNIPRKQLRAQFDKLPWHSAPTFEEWEKELAAVRERGYAIDNGNYIGGVTIIAAPILDQRGNFQHAIAAIAISHRLSDEARDQLGADVKAAAHEIAMMQRV